MLKEKINNKMIYICNINMWKTRYICDIYKYIDIIKKEVYMVNIEIGKHAGFCGGVNLCIKTLEEKLANEKNVIYCLGELVHNKEVVNSFKEKGVIFVDKLEDVPNNAKLVIRAHGAEKHTYEVARNRGMDILDLTCPKVAKIKEDVKEYITDDSYIVLVAKKEHPEAKSTISFLGVNASIVEDENDLHEIIGKLSKYSNVVIISQTTFDEKIFLSYAKFIEDNVDKNVNVIIKNTICNATSIRQEEIRTMAKEKELMLIVGGKNSSNTHKLYNIAKNECEETYWVETKDELELDIIKGKVNIGIMAGASTPKNVIDDVVQAIQEYEG